MNPRFGPALLAGSLLAVGVPMAAHAASGRASDSGALTLCVAEGAGHIIVSGFPTPGFAAFDTGRLQATVSGTNNLSYSPATGYSGNYNVTTTPACTLVPAGAIPSGSYTLQMASPLDAPCYQTVNGDLVNPPYLVGNQSNPAHTPRCPGKVYEILVSQNGGPTTVLRQDQFNATLNWGTIMKITFHVTDVRYFDCVSQTGPGSGTSLGSADNGNICEPNGPTGNPPAS